MRFSTHTVSKAAEPYNQPEMWLALVRRMMPGGHVSRTGEYTGVVNPLRDDRNAGSVFINVETQKFIDSAAPDTFSGRGPVKFLATLLGLSAQRDALAIDAILEHLAGGPVGLPPCAAGHPMLARGAFTAAEIDAARSMLEQAGPAQPKTEISFQPLPPIANVSALALSLYATLGAFETAFPVLDETGAAVAMELRFVDEAGDKHVRPLAYGADVNPQGGEFPARWVAKWPPRLPWHGYFDLFTKPADAVIEIVEGPKTMTARAAMRPDRVVLSAVAGLEDRHPWQCFTGRNVLVIADADEAGRQQAEKVLRRLKAVRANAAIVTMPDSFPRGWDLADPVPAGWTIERIEALIDERLATLTEAAAPAEAHGLRVDFMYNGEERCDVPVWPKGVLPAFDGLVDDLAAACGSSRGYVAASLITIASGLSIGSLMVEPIPGWRTHLMTWTVLSGSSSAGKTPALKTVLQPLMDVRAAFVARHIDDRNRWADLDKKERGDAPVGIELMLADDTIEAEHQCLAEQRCGILKVVQESAAFISDLQRYNANIRGARLASFDGMPLPVRRKHLETPLNVPLNGVSIVTTGQPDVLAQLFHDKVRDGLVNRFMFAMHAGDTVAGPVDPVEFETHQARLRRIFQRLVELRLLTVGAPAKAGTVAPAPVPVARFTPEAQAVFTAARTALQNRYARHSDFMAAWSFKATEFIARISGVLAMMDWADNGQHPRPPAEIDAETVRRAVTLVSEYFAPHTAAMHRISDEPPPIRNARALGWHLLREAKPFIDTVDIRHGAAVAGLRDERTMRDAILELQAAGWLLPGLFLSRSAFDHWPAQIPLRLDLFAHLKGLAS